MARDVPDAPHRRPDGVGFLLAQVGGHAARRFAERVSTLDLTPPQAGLLRAIARQPGRTQQHYAAHLGVPPSRFVTLVDSLERRGVVERRRSPDDRRAYGLHLTTEGDALMVTSAGSRAPTKTTCARGSARPSGKRCANCWPTSPKRRASPRAYTRDTATFRRP